MEKDDSRLRLFLSSGCLSEEAARLYAMGKLDENTRLEAKSHLDSCEFCTMAVEGLELYFKDHQEQQYEQLMVDLDQEVEKVFQATSTPMVPLRPTKSQSRMWTLAAIAATLVLLFGLYQAIQLWLPQQKQQTAQQVEKIPAPSSAPSAKTEVPAVAENMNTDLLITEKKNIIVEDREEATVFRNPAVTQEADQSENGVGLVKEDLNKFQFTPDVTVVGAPSANYSAPLNFSTPVAMDSANLGGVTYNLSDVTVTGAEQESRHKSKAKETVKASKTPQISEVKEDADDQKKEEVFTIVEEMPSFPGGQDSLNRFLVKNLRYPATAKESSIQGTVYVTFTVDRKGKIENPRVIRGIGGGCDEEVLRVIRLMPKWIPGKQAGKTVRVAFTLPVKFEL